MRGPSRRGAPLAHFVASALLGYPDRELFAARPVLAEAVRRLPAGEPARRLGAFLDHLDRVSPPALAAHYVAVFDLSARCCPYLTYYTHGDTRARGGALLRFRALCRTAGVEPVDGELPDHLAVVCELSGRSAVPGVEERTAEAGRRARELLAEHRGAVELLLRGLEAERSPYADVVGAVLATVQPGRRRARVFAEPPVEGVGLAGYMRGGRG
ncbi:nitrate reductase molybdenum cofactor assembly chaperone [Bailinhaonella thermotolerans]|uniref:Nitrate reductase molybdenum cofactor assembly chaperone n=1 Tax=Bailinhaonella thermotolerans TaxID=1070861 RepID=A0A3A4AVE8_9ACTN|nr:nitrate reductase molybdenum cofactor assembly chaperone [Bailinhaonella thermotolerans]RJL30047.1 nitrate reductase molybdenum cofactor assembly chaperone [Bailinhaonella thermotolerans]